MSFDVDAGTSYEDVINFGEKFTNTMPTRFGTYLEKAVLMILDKARNNLQNQRSINTGTLLASLRVLSAAKEGMEFTLGSEIPYAKYVEYGRGEVVPKNKKVLSWIDPQTGKRIFSKYSGPVEPKPFLEPAVIEVMSKFPQIVFENETEYIKELL